MDPRMKELVQVMAAAVKEHVAKAVSKCATVDQLNSLELEFACALRRGPTPDVAAFDELRHQLKRQGEHLQRLETKVAALKAQSNV